MTSYIVSALSKSSGSFSPMSASPTSASLMYAAKTLSSSSVCEWIVPAFTPPVISRPALA